MSKKKRIIVNTCYDHISGILGESIFKLFLKDGLIEKRSDDEYAITKKGWEELEIIGIDVDKIRSSERKIVNICIESNNGIFYEHIGSYLGALLKDKMFDLGWLEKINGKSYELTEKGFKGLENLGVKIKTI